MGWRIDSEQRQNRRVSVELPLRFAVKSSVGAEALNFMHATTTNISAAGVGFVAAVNMPLHTRLAVRVELPGIAQELDAEGLVVRIVADRPEIQGIEYGVRFERVSSREHIEQYVRSVDICPLLKLMVKQGATDLHLTVNSPPFLRIGKTLVPAGERSFSPEIVEALVHGVMSVQHRRKLRRWRDVSFPYVVPGLGRWQANVFYQRGFVEATFHTIALDVPTVDQLGLPPIVREWVKEDSGLVLVAGPTKSGKSTTLGALAGLLNQETGRVITMLETPLSYSFDNRRSVVRQREVGSDVRSYADGIRAALLQDCDVVTVGEVTEPETAEMVLRAAETGRLVIAAVPATDSIDALLRLVSLRPVDERVGVLHVLASSLRGILSQRLLPQLDGRGLALATEVIAMNDTIRNAIRTDKVDQISHLMRAVPGAQPWDVSLRNLVHRRLVDIDVAANYSQDSDRLRKALTELRV
jgi:twitching motility protein PilT